MIKFDWDVRKAASNLRKHGVSFEEAQSVFYDEYALQFLDAESSDTEDRFLLLGLSDRIRMLIVCHCERGAGQSSASFPPARQPGMSGNITKVLCHER